MNTITTTTNTSNYRVQAAFDGYFYPQVLDNGQYEYLCWDNGEDVRFLTEVEARIYIASLGVAA